MDIVARMKEMTVHCAGMSDEERFKHMKRTIELRAMVWSIKA